MGEYAMDRRRKPFLCLATAVLAICTGLACQAFAITPYPEPRICNEFKRADVVFVAKVLEFGFADKVYGDKDSGDYDPEGYYLSQFYRLRVLKTFKGKLPEEVTLYTSNDSGRGVLDENSKNVIFAYFRNGRLEFGGGGNTSWGVEADAVIAAIEDYLAGKLEKVAASIRGRVVTYGPPDGPQYLDAAPYLKLTVRKVNGKKAYTIRSGPEGWFELEVRPGVWRVYVSEPGWHSRPWDFSYNDPDRIDLSKGGCADLQIVAVPPAGDRADQDDPRERRDGSG